MGEIDKSIRLPVNSCGDLRSLTAYLLSFHVWECFYTCSHGRCINPSEHNYFDIAAFKRVNDRVWEVGASFTAKKLRRDTQISDLTLHVDDANTLEKFIQVFKFNAKLQMSVALPRGANEVLLRQSRPMAIVNDKLYHVDPVR